MLKECPKMYKFDHPNVLNMRGVCLDGGPAPFMANGSLLAYLKKNHGMLTVSTKGSAVDVGEVTVPCNNYYCTSSQIMHATKCLI